MNLDYPTFDQQKVLNKMVKTCHHRFKISGEITVQCVKCGKIYELMREK